MTHNTREVEEIVEQFEKRMPLITSHGLLLEARLTPTSYLKMKEWLRTTLHHQLQKARHDWLREEIVRLEGAMYDKPRGYRGKAFNEAFQTIIDRYKEELDQDKK